jgi:hypothetical protein
MRRRLGGLGFGRDYYCGRFGTVFRCRIQGDLGNSSLGYDALRGSRGKGLRNRLFSTATATAAATTAAASASTLAVGAGRRAALVGRAGQLRGSGVRLGLRLGCGRNVRFVAAGLQMWRIEVARLGRWAGSLLRIEIRRLQGRRRRFTSRLRSFLLAAL